MQSHGLSMTPVSIKQKAQKKDQELKIYYKKNVNTPKKDMCFQLIKDTKVLRFDDK